MMMMMVSNMFIESRWLVLRKQRNEQQNYCHIQRQHAVGSYRSSNNKFRKGRRKGEEKRMIMHRRE
jgi:hypothetical protein